MNKILYLHEYKYIPTEIVYWKNDEMLYSSDEKYTLGMRERQIVWAGIGTYLTEQDGEIYMCALIDETNKKVCAYSFGVYRSAELVGKALEVLVDGGKCQNTMLKTSRNILYKAKCYKEIIDRHGIESEMTPSGTRGQAAIVSSYFSSLMRRKGKRVFRNWQDAINWLEEDVRIYNGIGCNN